VEKIELLLPFMTGFGGTEKVIHNLVEASKTDPETQIHVTQYGGTLDTYWIKDSDYSDVKMASAKKVRTVQYLIMLPFWIFKKVKSTDANVIISTNPVMWALSFLWKTVLKRNISVVAWYHYSLKKKKVSKFALKKADKYLAISSGVQEELLSYGISEENVHLIYNPVQNSTRLIPRDKKIINLIYVGRVMLHGQKNLIELFEALSMLSTTLKWTLKIYGDGVPREVEQAKKFVQQNMLEEKVSFEGFNDNVWNEIKYADALVLTSTYEGFGMVLAEALTHGVFVVSSDCETGPKDIINGHNGFIYHQGDTNELKNDLSKIISRDYHLPSQEYLAESASKFSESNYYKRFVSAIKTEEIQ
jgi:UDP-D-galactose:(glucosyl)LPS alpha-1,6-D-galactosyltransferase